METLVFVGTVVGVFSLFGVVGARLARRSGRAAEGFVWGFVVGPLGWIAPALWTPKR